MKKYASLRDIVIIALGCSAVGVFLVRHFSWPASAQSAISIKPFVATYTTADFAGDNSLIEAEFRGYALRSDGASVVSFYRPSPAEGSKLVSIHTVTDPGTRTATRVAPLINSKVTYPLTQAQLEAERATLTASCVGERVEPILGYAVLKSQETISSSASVQLGPAYDKIHFDRWRAPALNCAPLRTEVSFFKDGRLVQRRVATYLAIREGEPDSSLFKIPEDYIERTPSDAVAEAARRFPNDVRFGRQCAMPQLDDVYLRARERSPAIR